MKAALTVAVVLALGAGIYYALKMRAEAPPSVSENPEAALAATNPASGGAASGATSINPFDAWRGRVVRGARSYSLALDSAVGGNTAAVTRQLNGARRVAAILETAATTESQRELSYRLSFINPAAVVAGLRYYGKTREADAIKAAYDETKAAVAASPSLYLAGRDGAYKLGPVLGLRVTA